MYSPANTSTYSKRPSGIDISQISSIGTPLEQSTPTYLFGNRNNTPSSGIPNGPVNTFSAPCNDIFAQPQTNVPQHIQKESNKSVHWSPHLVQSDKINKTGTPLRGDANTSLTSKTITSTFGGQTLNAPPLRSLRDKIEPAKKIARRNTFSARTTASNTSNIFDKTPTVQNRTLNESNITQQENDTDAADTWVTVFGFDPEQISILLNLFSRHGEVVSHQRPSRGNFMHIRYSCITHAQQALSRNGTLLDSNTYIGVIPCKNKNVINGTATGIVVSSSTANKSLCSSILEEPTNDNNDSIMPDNENSILNASNFNANTSLNSSRLSVRSGVGMRPLAVDQRTNSVKQDGLLNKLWTSIGL